MNKLIIVGLDGLSMSLFRSFSEKGIVPGLDKLVDLGFITELESTVPPVTGPAWATFATGVHPGKHGVYDFALPDHSMSDLIPVNSNSIAVPTFFEKLSEHGMKAIIVNLPLSWPPNTEFPTLTSLMTQSDQAVYPPGLLKSEILRDYQITPEIPPPPKSSFSKYIQSIHDLELKKMLCVDFLLENCEWDVVFVLFGATDWISHIAYSDLVTTKIHDKIRRLILEIDRYISSLMDKYGSSANLIIMSDHGFRSTETQFMVNSWLEKNKYLISRRGESNNPYKHKFSQLKNKGRIIKVGFLRNILRLPFGRGIFTNFYSLAREIAGIIGIRLQVDITFDPTKTVAACLSHESNAIYINGKRRFRDGVVDDSTYDEIREEIINKLVQVSDPDTGEKVFTEVRKSEEVYKGEMVKYAPDIVLFPADKYKVGSSIARPSCFNRVNTNDHHKMGIFAAYGPDIRMGGNPKDPDISCIAPTILHLLGLPIEEGTDGRVLYEIFKEESEATRRDVRISRTTVSGIKMDDSIVRDGGETLVIDRLRDLGYL